MAVRVWKIFPGTQGLVGAPNLVGRVDHQTELGPVDLRRNFVAMHRTREAALRAQADIFKDSACSLESNIYAPLSGLLPPASSGLFDKQE